nr:peptide chain release factor 3 [Hyphomicrobiales bacterium]
TLTEGEELRFTGIPNFAPEILRRVQLDDPARGKQLRKALEDMAEEGVVQLFTPLLGAQPVIGVVGQLQLDVLASRISMEYKVEARFQPVAFDCVRWIHGDDAEVKRFITGRRDVMAEDRDGAPVFFARSAWELKHFAQEWPKLEFNKTKERA